MVDFDGKLVGKFISPMDPNGNKVQQRIIHEFVLFQMLNVVAFTDIYHQEYLNGSKKTTHWVPGYVQTPSFLLLVAFVIWAVTKT